MPEHPIDKSALRRELRGRRDAVDAAVRDAAARSAATRLAEFTDWPGLRSLAIYLPRGGEFDTGAICELAREQDKQLYLPVLMPGNRLDFALWRPGDALTPNRFDIPEPGPAAPRQSPDDIDLVCMPLMGWTSGGDRLGMGGGFYDRTLARCSSVKLGLGFELQRCEDLIPEPWDVRMDYVLTESALYRCQGGDDG